MIFKDFIYYMKVCCVILGFIKRPKLALKAIDGTNF